MFQVSIANCAHGSVSIIDERTRWTLLPAAHQRHGLHTHLSRFTAHLTRVPRIPIGVCASTAFPQTGADLFRTLALCFLGFLWSQIVSDGWVVMVGGIPGSLVLSRSVLLGCLVGRTPFLIVHAEAHHQSCLKTAVRRIRSLRLLPCVMVGRTCRC